MLTQKIIENLIELFGSDYLSQETNQQLQTTLLVKSEILAALCLHLRDNPTTYFDTLSCLSAVDYYPEDMRFGAVYQLSSIPYQTQLVLKVRAIQQDLGLPCLPTVSHIWRTADWHEREAYDMMGIVFEGHPDLRRMLLPDDWEGFPLRKDYIHAETYKGIRID